MRVFVVAAAAWLVAASAALANCARPETISLAGPDKTGTESGGAVYCFQVAAQAGQRMGVSIASANNDVVFIIFAPGWETSCTADGDCDIEGEQLSEDNATSWADTAPSTGNYLVVIENSRSDADYELSVDVR